MNTEKLNKLIDAYKAHFNKNIPNEIYKWKAVKCFQDNWDVEAEDFVLMLQQSMFIAKEENLLTAHYFYPYLMIEKYAKLYKEEVRSAFRILFDENKDLKVRINFFKNKIEDLRKRTNEKEGKDNQSYHNDNTISIYLWLRYPDKYYIYKSTITQKVFNELGIDAKLRGKGIDDAIIKCYEVYDEIAVQFKQDGNVRKLLDSAITTDCYEDAEMKTVVVDFAFYVGKYRQFEQKNAEKSMEIQEEIQNNIDNKLWFVGYTFGGDGSQIERFVEDSVWESRFDENNPIDQKQISLVKSIKKGDVLILKSTSTKGANHDMPFLRIKAIGIVANDIEFTKVDNLTQCKFDVDYVNSEEKDFDGSIYGAYRQTIHQVGAKLKEVIDYVNNHITKTDKITPYSKQDFLNDVFMTENDYNKLHDLLLRKKNIILQGAPGVGKTFCAKRLAYSIIGNKNENHICHVQFHQNYSYEDFIMGYKPEEDKFILRKGIFYDFCTLVKNNPNDKYFFIIDEINRGNLSKIFGELLMLIENNYRGDKHKIRLAYNNEEFYVPENLYIIGMMNTADRSLAMIDYALRRRFSFFEMKPGFETDGFKSLINKVENDKFKNLIEQIKKINEQIVADDSLGKGFEIGHSYFCFDKEENITDEKLLSIIDYDIIPMIEEYWFDNKGNVKTWTENLRKIFEKQ